MRISDWSSDVCSSDLAPQRQINYLLLASAYSSLRRQGVSALRIADLLKESSRFAAWPASLSTLVLALFLGLLVWGMTHPPGAPDLAERPPPALVGTDAPAPAGPDVELYKAMQHGSASCRERVCQSV